MGAEGCLVDPAVFKTAAGGVPARVCSIHTRPRHFDEKGATAMEFQKEANRIFAQAADGTLIAEITFPACGDGVVDINRTFVDDSLRGQGVAAQLAQAAAEQVRARGLKAIASCSYAKKWFAQHPEQADLLSGQGC
jgi:predicted GNAT family acetyltransferase